jgi:hypothetical protein
LTSYGFPASRGQQHAGGADSPDVKCPSLPGIHFEVKRVEKLLLDKALAQASKDAGFEKLPVVAYRKNQGQWIAIMPMCDLLSILKRHNS